MDNKLQVIDVPVKSECTLLPALTVEKMVAQVDLIQKVMQKIMRKDEHYGVIPFCGNKPTLLKPGAEKLAFVFRMAPKYERIITNLPGGHKEYEFICNLFHIETGAFMGSGVGCCSTMETKYRYKNAAKKCPDCGKEAIIKGKTEYGGGWICYAKKEGCGNKWDDGDPIIENQKTGKIENDNPADFYNTVEKMGKKRAQVDATLTATAASDIFTQDVEDTKNNQSSGPDDKTNKKNKEEKKTEDEVDKILIIRESHRTLDQLKEKMNEIDNLYHFQNWNKNQDKLYQLLTAEHKNDFLAARKEKYEELSKKADKKKQDQTERNANLFSAAQETVMDIKPMNVRDKLIKEIAGDKGISELDDKECKKIYDEANRISQNAINKECSQAMSNNIARDVKI